MFGRTLTLLLSLMSISAALYIIFCTQLSKLDYNNLLPLNSDSYSSLTAENTSIYFKNEQTSVHSIVDKQEKIIFKHTTTVVTTNTQKLNEKKTNQLLVQSDSRLTCLDGIVTLIPGGRLANKIFEYASACILAYTLNYRCSVPLETLKGLQTVFTNISASVLENEINSGQCKGKKLTAKFVTGNGPKKPIDLVQYQQWARESKQPIILWLVKS